MAAILLMAAIGAWAITTHRITYVVTHGVSMNPAYHADDLVILLKSDSYETGEVAAYHGAGGRIEVLHRIIGGNGIDGYVLKGDNNPSIDADTPTDAEMIGHAVLHVPKGGTWLQPLLSPTGLGMLGFLFVSGGAAVPKNRRGIPRGHQKKKVKGMSGGGGSWATAAAVFKAIGRLHPALRALAAASAICGVAGVALGLAGWMKPITEASTGIPEESMTFSYSAEVPRSPAYDGTTVYSPDPIFRKLTNLVDLHMQYRGSPGEFQVGARLSAKNGWHKTLQLSQQRQFATANYSDQVQLDLNLLEQHARAAGDAIGADMGAITVGITAQVRHNDGTVFAPQVALTLIPFQLTLDGDPAKLTVDQTDITAGAVFQDRHIGAFGHDLLTAADARGYATYLVLIALASAAVIATVALRRVPLRTRAQIQRRYPHLLVPVEPMASPPGKPVVIVDTFPALVKLAEKYGQMILTWTRPDGADDFVVRDEGILYRYRVEPEPIAPPAAAGSEAPQNDHVPADEAVPDTTPLPALHLPPAPEPPSDLPAGQAMVTDTGDAPAAAGEPPTKKSAPRKRASRTTAAKAVDVEAEAAVHPAGTPPTEPEPSGPKSVAPQPPRSRKRASRRKSRSRAAGEEPAAEATTAVDQSEPQPAVTAREEVETLAAGNRSIAAPEPVREPIYDFLPAAKRVPVRPEPDDDAE